MGEHHLLLSASQIEKFTECERKWGFQYLAGLKEDSKPSMLLGTETHEQLGRYLIEGQELNFTLKSGEIANAVLPLLPPAKTPGLVVERKFVIPSPTGEFAYQGFIDLYAPDSACVPGLTGGAPLLGDFKTTSDFKYAKTEEILKTNIQAQLYAMALMFEENVNTLDLVWFTSRTRGAKRALRAHLRVHAPHVAEQFGRIDEIGARVAAIKAAKPAVLELTPNPRMCDEYGGCPHRHRCALSPSTHASAVDMEARKLMEQASTDFLANLRKGTATPSAAPTPTAAAVDPIAVLKAQLAAAEAEAVQAAQAAYVPPAPPNPMVGVTPEQAPLPAWATAPVDPRFPKPAINPPESALPPAPPVGAAAPAAEAPKKRGRPAKTETAAPNDAPLPELQDVAALAKLMKNEGIKRLVFDGAQVREIEAV